MTSEQSALLVAKRIKEILDNKVYKGVYALANRYSGEMQKDFLDRQMSGQPSNGITPWQNQTNQAMQRVRFRPYIRQNAIGVRGTHGVEYGIHLERANNRKHAMLLPIISRIGKMFLDDARELMK